MLLTQLFRLLFCFYALQFDTLNQICSFQEAREVRFSSASPRLSAARHALWFSVRARGLLNMQAFPPGTLSFDCFSMCSFCHFSYSTSRMVAALRHSAIKRPRKVNRGSVGSPQTRRPRSAVSVSVCRSTACCLRTAASFCSDDILTSTAVSFHCIKSALTDRPCTGCVVDFSLCMSHAAIHFLFPARAGKSRRLA